MQKVILKLDIDSEKIKNYIADVLLNYNNQFNEEEDYEFEGYDNEEILDYYNKNAKSFYLTTKDVDFHVIQDKFLSYLHKKAQILDFGCGSGRDTKYFLDKGYNVEAWDGSKELCKLASEYTGIQVQNKMFFELEAVSEYDGIWACSSILHLPKDELENVLHRCLQH